MVNSFGFTVPVIEGTVVKIKEEELDSEEEMEGKEILENTPSFFKKRANDDDDDPVPKKSKNTYDKKYWYFRKWCEIKDVKNITENVLLDYFNEKSKTFKYSTLWSTYSMLKSTLSTYHNIDISNFNRLKNYIKRQGAGYKAKKSKVFTHDDINKFLTEASDDKYLVWKVALIVGVAGACSCIELLNMKIDDIQECGDILIGQIPNTKHNTERTFILSDQIPSVNIKDLYKKYVALRPTVMPHQRLFISYRNGKCTVQPVGINTLAKIPSYIAQYLKLPNPEDYSGHCFRRTASKLLTSEVIGDMFRLKHLGRWKRRLRQEDS